MPPLSVSLSITRGRSITRILSLSLHRTMSADGGVNMTDTLTVTVRDKQINTNNLLHQSIISCILILALAWISFKIYEKHRHALRPHVTAQILFLGEHHNLTFYIYLMDISI